ncbi:MAG: choice-of-anchor V domain-containing protein [Bacteroidota bacterium]|nr:choice-of-anchor V domain-containing protein [Bacteroidota bacterium]
MKKLLFLCASALALAVIFYPSSTISNSSGSPGNMTGAPGENTCTACHSSFGLNTGTGTVSLTSNIPASGYTPGSTYTVTATVSDSGINQFGFEAFGGDFLNINSSEMQSLAPNRITHTASGTQGSDSKSWTFDWVTPIGNPGALTLYASFVAADYPIGNSGDHVYSTSLTVNEAVAVPGCTDSLACNFDPLATIDDGSCVYSTSSTTTLTACDSLFWGDTTYSSSGTYAWIGINSVGCDSLAILNLTIGISGCTDSTALNYDSTATCNNGTCIYFQNNSVDLFFSEYAEGSSGTTNRYFEIYNPTQDTIDLSDYAFARVSGNPSTVGVYETWVNFDSGAVILPYDVYVVSHSSSNTAIQVESDMNSNFLSNGDDGMALVYGLEPLAPEPPSSGYYMILDWVGDWNGDPGSGWNVAGETAATRDHTLVRKCSISQGDTSWSNAAGTNPQNSQWVVLSANSFSNIGQHDASSISYSQSDTICGGLSITVGNNTYDSTGIYLDTLQTQFGCDSIITTQLTVLATSASIVTNDLTICNGSFVMVGNSIYTTSGSYSDTLINSAGCDSIINTNLTVQTPVSLEYTICDGDSVVVGSSTYYMSGNYTDTIQSSIGCDSIVHTNIIVYSQLLISGGIENNTVGGGGYFSGSQYLELSCYMSSELVSAVVYSQTASITTFEIRDVAGNVLDSITVNVIPGGQRVYFNYQMTAGTDYQIGVNGSSNGLYRNNSGVNYPYDFAGAASITSSSAGAAYYYFFYDVEVRVLSIAALTSNYSICDGDTIQVAGSVYTTTGFYTDTLTSYIGCDSVVYTNLIVNPNVSYLNNQTICNGEFYTIGNSTYDSTGIYHDTLVSPQGCDSIVTTNLTVLTISGTGSTNLQTICVGESYSIVNNTYNTAGTYYDTLVSSQNCDSIITTILTVNSANYMSINGGILDSTSGPGAFSSYDGHLIIDNNILSVLQAATVYAEDTNDVTFELRDNNGVVLESVIHTVYPGSQRLTFDFMIPVGNDFELGVDPNASGGVIGLYRSNAGAGNTWPYPFNLGPTTITSSNAGDRYYYYYYDIEIMPYATNNKKFICKGDSIQVGTNIYDTTGNYIDTVGLSTTGCDSVVYTILDFYQSPSLSIQTIPDPPQICLGDSVILEASDGFVFYWWNNGQFGDRIVEDPTQDTWYVVEAKDSNNCVVKEDIWVYVDSCFTGINNIPINEILVYPNPTNDYINISFESLSSQNIELRIYNLLGEELSSISLAEFHGYFNRRLDLRGYAKSIYFVEITTKDFVINKKVIFE